MNSRINYIDYLRSFIFLILLFDHACHAYAYFWGSSWFVHDTTRFIFFDFIHRINHNIIMPGIFFICGLFVLPSIDKKGGGLFFYHRFLKLIIPFIIGVLFIVPILVFPKYQLYGGKESYLTFWMGDFDFNSTYFLEKIQSGPLWVPFNLFFYSIILLLCYKLSLVKKILSKVSFFIERSIENPIKIFLIIIFLSSFIMFICEILWGTRYWFTLSNILTNENNYIPKTLFVTLKYIFRLFSFHGSRFLLLFLFFLLGALSYSLITKESFLNKLKNNFSILCGFMIITGIGYLWMDRYGFFQDPDYYWFEIHINFNDFYWFEVISSNISFFSQMYLRILLQAAFCFLQLLVLITWFNSKQSSYHPIWNFLAQNTWGIFLFHEMITVWLQYLLRGYGLNVFIKIIIVIFLSFSSAAILTSILKKIPLLKRVL